MTNPNPFPQLPSEFWDQLEVTEAAEARDFGKLLKAFRQLQSPPIKQQVLAEAMGITQPQISRIESGKTAVTDLSKLARWAKLIQAPARRLWFDVPEPRTEPQGVGRGVGAVAEADEGEGDGVDRRSFMKTASATSAAVAVGPRPEISHAVGSSDVERLRMRTEAFRRMDNRWGAGELIDEVDFYLDRKVLPLLRDPRGTKSTKAAMDAAGADLFQLVGWMHYDTNDRVNGKKALRNAYSLAERSGDHALAAEMQAAISHQSSFLRMADLAESSALHAADQAKRSGVTSVQAEAAVMEAHALALQGDESGTKKALARAETWFERSQGGEKPEWHQYFDASYLSAKFGHVLRDLGRPEEAEPFARNCLNMSEGYERGRVFNLCLLAGVLADKGEPDEAIEHAEWALKMTTSIRSSRMRTYLSDLAQRFAPYRSNERVQRYCRQLTGMGIPLRVVG